MICAADHGGILVILEADEGETRPMLIDRAHLVAKALSIDRFATDATVRDKTRVARAWVCSKHYGCAYAGDIARDVSRIDVNRSR